MMVYIVYLKTNRMNTIDNKINGANGLGLSINQNILTIGNCKWKHSLTIYDLMDIYGNDLGLKRYDDDWFYYQQLYWKQYYRENINDEFRLNNSKIFIHSPDYFDDSAFFKFSLNNGTMLDMDMEMDAKLLNNFNLFYQVYQMVLWKMIMVIGGLYIIIIIIKNQ